MSCLSLVTRPKTLLECHWFRAVIDACGHARHLGAHRKGFYSLYHRPFLQHRQFITSEQLISEKPLTINKINSLIVPEEVEFVSFSQIISPTTV